MIDYNNTTLDWQKHRTDILVWPIGATEQHGPNLPLNCDSLIAEYTAKIVAEHFNAAMLPVLDIANSFEHSGFRGSFSLRPETLMQVVRDIVDEAERQNFKIIIIINGHGGNRALDPVCRHINSLNRPVKIILHNAFSLVDNTMLESGQLGVADMHAGEFESSIYAAISGKPITSSIPHEPEKNELTQSDLITFGIGFLSSNGVVGLSEKASLDKGIALIKSVKKTMLEFLTIRIKKLRQQLRYSGVGGLSFRTAELVDLSALWALSSQANWNQTREDWKYFIDNEQVITVIQNNKIVGSGSLITYSNKLAWIGMVITDLNYRRLGIASKIINYFVENYPQLNIYLDASSDGTKVYEKLNFVASSTVIKRFSLTTKLQAKLNPMVSKVESEDLPIILKKYDQAFRLDFLQKYFKSWNKFGNQAVASGRTGRLKNQFGPLYADNLESAWGLLLDFANQNMGMIIDVPAQHKEFIARLEESGFCFEREFIRMGYKTNKTIDNLTNCYAIAGPEFC